MILQKKVAIVTGGGQGTGKALSEAIPQGIATRFLAEGIKGAIAEINQAAGKETEAEFKHLGSIRFFNGDVYDQDSIKNLMGIRLSL